MNIIKSENILFIMRHARSEWPSNLYRDFERPLDSTGIEQALEISSKLSLLNLLIDHALVSPALRTRQTFELVTQKLAHAPEVIFDKRLYNACFLDVFNILSEQAEAYKNLLFIGHNPSVSELCYKLCKEFYDFKPGCLAILRAKKHSLAHSLEADFGFNLEKVITPHA
jgi:phosphohistidine phosphatase